jgi:mono/diheme cytochrome c family protein
MHRRTAMAAGAACLLLFAATAGAAGDRHAETMAAVSEKSGVNIKGVFAGNCSWCHDGFGMHGGKGPKLAGTTKSIEQLVDRISNGKPGYMPGYAKSLDPKKIEALAEYIKKLPADE